MNFDLKVKEIPVETFLLIGKIENKEIINNLIHFIKNNKDEKLSYKTSVKAHFTGFRSLIENKNFIEFTKIIQTHIHIICQNKFEIFEAWGNLCKINEEIVEHNHNGIGLDGFCGILYLTEGGPGTYFKNYDLLIEEEIGKFILFHPALLHKVDKILNNLERITVAFNARQIKENNN
jgi:hypothetical protein